MHNLNLNLHIFDFLFVLILPCYHLGQKLWNLQCLQGCPQEVWSRHLHPEELEQCFDLVEYLFQAHHLTDSVAMAMVLKYLRLYSHRGDWSPASISKFQLFTENHR